MKNITDSFVEFLQNNEIRKNIKEIIKPVGNLVYNEVYIYIWIICIYNIFLIVLFLIIIYLLLKLLKLVKSNQL
jgi:hypothetical protein